MSIFIASAPPSNIIPTVYSYGRQNNNATLAAMAGTPLLSMTPPMTYNTLDTSGDILSGFLAEIGTGAPSGQERIVQAGANYRNGQLVALLSAPPSSVSAQNYGRSFEYRLAVDGPLYLRSNPTVQQTVCFGGYWDGQTAFDNAFGAIPGVPAIGWIWRAGDATWHAWAQAEGGATLFDVAISGAAPGNDDERELRIGVEGGSPFASFWLNGAPVYSATLPLALNAASDLQLAPLWVASRGSNNEEIGWLMHTRGGPQETLVLK